jgi:hypothetical protein
MGEHVTRILCVAEPRGSADAIRQLGDVAAERDVDATIVVGDIGGGPDRRESYRAVFKAFVGLRSPVYWVPGAGDAPVGDYLRETYNDRSPTARAAIARRSSAARLAWRGRSRSRRGRSVASARENEDQARFRRCPSLATCPG